MMLPVLLTLISSLGAEPLPPAAQALLDQAKAANPTRYRFAIDQGATIEATSDGRSFYVLWTPKEATGRTPMVVSLHGTAGWAFDELALWHAEASRAGYGILALQWWLGGGDATSDYYTPTDVHRELRAVLGARGYGEGSALLHGFSRGSANIYAVTALDRQSKDRYYAMTLANSGGASVDYPPNVQISTGGYGWDVFSGTYWAYYCGGRDPNPDRDGCPAMRRSAEWVSRYGGVTALTLEEPDASHGGFHMSATNVRAVLKAFADNLALRTNPGLTNAIWEVKRDPLFEIAGASTPNVGYVNGEVWLMVGAGGTRLYRSKDGANTTVWEQPQGLQSAMSDYGVGEVVPRQGKDGTPVLFVLGLAPPGTNRSALFRLVNSGPGYVRNPRTPVFPGGPLDGNFIGVPDVTPTVDGRLRLTYVARGATPNNSRTAISNDEGASFTAEVTNLFGDLALPNPKGTDINVDPAILKLSRGGYLGVGMRGARLFLFTSLDGRTFVPSGQAPIEAGDLAPGTTGLFDPTLVELPDGRIFLYATAGADPGSGSKVVRAELVRRGPQLTYRSRVELTPGTIRPEVLVTSKGEFVVVVADPQGSAVGQVKHKALRYSAAWEPLGAPFAVTRITSEYGEPADHRAALVNDELVVVYQSLVWRNGPPVGGGGPAEVAAKDQSLLIARFTLDGQEVMRKAIVANAPEPREENFPDFCMVWHGDHLLVSTGNLGGSVKMRKVGLDGTLLDTVVFEASENGVPDNIGNSMVMDGEKLWMWSASGPNRTAALMATMLGEDLRPGEPVVFEEKDREQHFPVSSVVDGEMVFVGYESRPRGRGGLPEQNPYAPYLKILGRDLMVLGDFKMGEQGFVAVHPMVVRAGNRLIFAWSRSVQNGPRTMPQVVIDEYRIDP